MNINNKPLIISVSGCLGNQLFMLFAGISKAIDENRDYLINLEETTKNNYFDNFLSVIYNKVINFNNIQTEIITVYNEPNFYYNEIPDNYDLIKGNYQSYKYFQNNSEKIINDLQIKTIQNNYRINLKAIAIHFCLGDYIKLNHDCRILSFVYYLKAILQLKQLLPDFDEYVFVIFGEKENNVLIDDYIKQINFNLDKPVNFIKIYERYTNISDYEEFLYMNNCNHFIIANSSFSWFGAYMSNNSDDKIIIHPSKTKWFIDTNDNKYDLKDYFIDDWIEIDY